MQIVGSEFTGPSAEAKWRHVINLSGLWFRLKGWWSFCVWRTVWYWTKKAVVFCSLPSPLVVVQKLTVLLLKLLGLGSSASLNLTAISNTQVLEGDRQSKGLVQIQPSSRLEIDEESPFFVWTCGCVVSDRSKTPVGFFWKKSGLSSPLQLL